MLQCGNKNLGTEAKLKQPVAIGWTVLVGLSGLPDDDNKIYISQHSTDNEHFV